MPFFKKSRPASGSPMGTKGKGKKGASGSMLKPRPQLIKGTPGGAMQKPITRRVKK